MRHLPFTIATAWLRRSPRLSLLEVVSADGVKMQEENTSITVALIPEKQRCEEVADIHKAELAPGGSLLGCLVGVRGRLVVWDAADREAPPADVDGCYRDFSWEEVTVHSPDVLSFRLLAVGSEWDLKLLQVDAVRSASVSLLCVSECPADSLLQSIREQDPSVCELHSVRVLSFVSGCCCVLLNDDWLLQLQWQRAEAEPEIFTCCNIQSADGDRHSSVHYCVRMETLFTLSSAGLISVCDITDGRRLATVDLTACQSSRLVEDDLSSSSAVPSPTSSFCLLQVSADLSTVVAVTQSHVAVGVDLDHYFRMHPDHLLCAVPPARPLQPQHPGDQDGQSSSSCSLAALGLSFGADRSWEARLASMYSRAQQDPTVSSSSSSPPAWTSWSSSLPHLESHQAPSLAHSRIPFGAAVVPFSVPKLSSPCLLAVSEFSALLTFISPGNRQTTVASWEFKSGSVSYQEAEGEAAPLQCCGQRQHRLLLKKAGVFQVLFLVSQQDLLSRLMLFGSAATVDAVCHLNSWGRCSIPIHALQAGLKNRQLDTVEFFLKSKENLLNPKTVFVPAAPPTASTQSLTHCVQELCPALDLLCSSVRDSNSEAESRQFSEQLLNITLNFVNTQIRCVLSMSHYEDADVQSCVDVLDQYVSKLRTFMKRFPWSTGSHAARADLAVAQGEVQEDGWEELPTEELVHQAILTNQMPRAQAVLRRRRQPEQLLSALKMEGLRQVFSCLERRDLQTATTLLINMGFSVKEQLHTICLHTDQKDLRELLVTELSRRGYFPEEQMQSVVFIRQMEKLGSLPTSRCLTCPRFAQMLCREALAEVEGWRQSGEECGLWWNLRLDWIRNWEQSCQTSILLSRLQHTELHSCDSAVLWRYLTARHDQGRVVSWIQKQENSSTWAWPELTPELVNNNTMCSTFMRENILDLLARRGLFVPEEQADLEKLLWRLAQGGGVMASLPPIPQYRSSLGLDLHSLVITLCLDRSLQYLLYTYQEHYRLTPRNCPLLTNQSLSVSQPWFEMMVKIQEITRDLSDPRLVFQASLTSAQVLLPGSQASLSSLLLEGHSSLALAAIMFAPGGIDQVVAQGERSGRSGGTVDPQLLKMALAPHSKLKAALFPTGPQGHVPSSDISVYHLLQSLHPLDPSRLFGWQVANTLNSTETSELPHFSSPHLVHRFAVLENLDFLYYLRHGRPSFAYATFLIQQLSSCSDLTVLWQQAQQQVYRLALQFVNVASVASAAICFCELLGVCSLKLRVDVSAMNIILQHCSQHNTHTAATQQLHTMGVKLAEAEPGAAEKLIGCLETVVAERVAQKGISRSSYEASQEWALPVQFCHLHGLELSSVYPAHCADDGQFVHFLLFVQLHSFPPQQVKSLVTRFSPALKTHLTLAFQDLQMHHPTRSTESDKQLQFLSTERASGSPEHPRELFQVLLQSQEQASPCSSLLHEAVVLRCPTLAVLAACQQGAELLPCLCVWLLTSVDDVTGGKATSHLLEAPQYHHWTLHDLSVIWRTLLGQGCVRPLLRGFELFQRDCPLVLVLRMFELCGDSRNFSEAKAKLLDFQRTLITLRIGGAASSGGLPLQWVESQASVLLLSMLQRCSSQYDLHRLLQLLADVNKLLKSNGPDFKKLSQLSQVLQGSGVSLSSRLLQCSSPTVQQEEFQAAMDDLQARGRYTQARQVALLAELPVHHLLLSQLHQEVNSHKSETPWRRLETRVSFWRRCQEQLKTEGADPEAASHFFLSHAAAATGSDPSSAAEAQVELLDVQERCLLLVLAAHWLSLLSPAPVDKLESLEEKLWLSRIRRHVLAVAVEKESVFNLPPPSVAAELNTYEVLMKELSFSNISALNTERCLSLEGLPHPPEEQEELHLSSGLSPEERCVLASLIGCLLDDGSIHEASRVCRYFSLYQPDVWLVLRCRGLASGELQPDTQEETSEDVPKKSMATSSSFSSLSLAMLPLPDDEVTVQLQKLVDQCRHGNNYCKQILSLYQLSKELQSSFSQVCGEEPRCVLEMLLLSDQPERFRKAQAFIKAQSVSADAVAQLVSSAVAQALMAPSSPGLQPAERQIFRASEGRDSLIQLIRLCEDPNLVGVKLLEKLSSVSLRDLNCIVELLIVAHDCFSLTCNMEGIVRVLQAARHLSHTHLASGEHYSLLVRLLTGIGRYNEMTYIFDLLHQNHRFEMLLRKKTDMDRGQSCSLKTALLDYIKRCLPADSEKHNMVALCFSMRREIGENHEMAARTQLKIIESQTWLVTPELKSSLIKVLGLLKDAAESFSKDSCVRQATRCVRMAKLVALQLHFLNQGSDVRVINLRPAEMLSTVTELPHCYQVFVVSEAYGFSPDWAHILYERVVLRGDFVYLDELKRHRALTSGLLEDVFKKLDAAPSSATPNVKRLLTHCDDVYSRYRLAYQQNLYDVIKTLLQDTKTSNYLNDRLSS